jgi:hypothetical protein
VAAALRGTDAGNGDLVAEPVKSVTDTDSAAVVQQDGATTDVPKDPESGVVLDSADAPKVTIGLPNADEAGNAKRLSDGTVVYPGTDGSAQAVIPSSEGVQMLTTIANADAPTRYAYRVDVPDGSKIEIVDGSAIVLDGNGSPMMAVAAPWAKDANGISVPTRFETDGSTLTQVIEHALGNYVYPVTADPFWIPAWVIWKLIKCGVGGAIGWITSGGQSWWVRAVAVGGGCLTSIW